MTFFEEADRLHAQNPNIKTVVYDFDRGLSKDKDKDYDILILGYTPYLEWSSLANIRNYKAVGDVILEPPVEEFPCELFIVKGLDTSNLYDSKGYPIYLNGIMKYS